jgi:type I restriction enzyme S subunit
MKSNYKKIGDYIRQIKLKNTESKYSELLGINIDKFFMPSVANIIGVDLSKYKVVQKDQFACNRMHVGRDYRIPVSLSRREEPFLVSPAYDVFEIIDKSILLPEYVMMWFSRKEFDRNAWFYTDADVRGGLPWSSFCEIELPIPSIATQREIVKEYNTIVNRISLNEQFIQKLEETAQAIYKQWFVEFEFPNEEGKPFKSSGGKLVWNDELDKEIPEGWETIILGDIIESFSKKHDFKKKELIFFNTSDILKGEFLHSNYMEVSKMPGQAKKQIRQGDILYSEIRPENKRFALVRIEAEDYVVSTKLMVLRLKTDKFSSYRLYKFLTDQEFIDELQFSAQGRSGTFPQITFELDIENKKMLIGSGNIEKKWSDFLNNYYSQLHTRKDENNYLFEIKEILLSRMTKVEEYIIFEN